MKKLMIFMGPPGAGKGSLSKLCVDRLNCVQLSTGNLCREHIAKNTEIGKKIDFFLKSGKLISDSVIIGMVENWLSDNASLDKPVILDGFPRTLNQAKALYELLSKSVFNNISLTIIRMNISDSQIIKRLSSRLICCNKDCQITYSTLKESDCLPKESNACDECKSDLIRRSDDDESSISRRLSEYRSNEDEIFRFFEKNDQRILEICVDQALEQIYNQLSHNVQ